MTRSLTLLALFGSMMATADSAQAQYGPAFEAAKRDVRYGSLVGPYGRDPRAVGQTYRDRQSTVGPFGGARTSGYRGGTFTNPDGSTVQYNTTYDAGRDPWGYGGGVRRDETMVTAPGGNAYVYSSSSRGALVAPPPPFSTTRRVSTSTTIGPYGATTRRSASTFRRGF